jgi:predicted unusual protein kinase regulating ubiquinone biosynthesis (AarF/ABC1/UbiB family)
MATFGHWLRTSPSLRQMGLENSVFTPTAYDHASAERVLTMDYVRGPTLSELSGDTSKLNSKIWQPALVRALTVAAVSIVDGPALFHADLHSGNMIMVMGSSSSFDQVAFIDFGCCGHLPKPLRNCLMMQASAFASKRPNIKQFTEGFAHALDRIPGLGPRDLNTDALAEDLKPLLREMQKKNPFRPGADPMDPELHALAFRLQMLLCYHGVQVPCEFVLLMKTACFGALYFSLLDATHRDHLLGHLLFSGAAYAACHPREATATLSRGTLVAFAKLFWSKKKKDMAPLAKTLACATTASIPLAVLASQYLM